MMASEKFSYRRPWSSPMRKELGLVLALFLVLLFLFQSDFTFRYASSVTGDWTYGSGSQSDEDSSRAPNSPSTGTATWSTAGRLQPVGMNELSLHWGKNHPIPQTTLLQHGFGMCDLPVTRLLAMVWN